MSAPECQKARPTTCIEQLASGWVLATDLCPACTAAFMAALDGIGQPLAWCEAYTARAAMA